MISDNIRSKIVLLVGGGGRGISTVWMGGSISVWGISVVELPNVINVGAGVGVVVRPPDELEELLLDEELEELLLDEEELEELLLDDEELLLEL